MKRKIFTILTALAIITVSVLPVPAAARTVSGQSTSISQLEQETAEAINSQRADYGLEPLSISATLSVQARVKARDMQTGGYFSHTSPTYGSPFAMMQALGVSYQSAAENIAMGYRSADAVVRAWMNSPSHRANLLSDRYTEMGVGYSGGYWALWLIR